MRITRLMLVYRALRYLRLILVYRTSCYLRLIMCVSVLTTLAACSSNTLVHHEAQRFSKASDQAITSGEAFYQEWIEQDRALWLGLYAYDPRCSPPALELTGGKSSETLAICFNSDGTKQSQVTRKRLKQEFLLLDFLRAYLTDMTGAIAMVDSNHAADNFKNSLSKLELLRTANGSEKPLFTEERQEATQGLLTFLQELTKASASAKSIRALAAKNGALASADLERLAALSANDLESIHTASNAMVATLKLRLQSDALDAQSRTSIARELLAINDAEDLILLCERKAKPEKKFICRAPAAGLLHAAAQAHSELLGALRGDLNDRQRALRANLALKNFLAIARLFVDFKAAF
jgi:hypothetical protein